MRAILICLLCVSTASPSFAACTTTRLAGNWTFTSLTAICPLSINAQGRATTTCINYESDPPRSLPLTFAFTVAPSCLVTGRMFPPGRPNDYISLRGRADQAETMMVGTILKLASFIATRN